jgi:hypothetical protein
MGTNISEQLKLQAKPFYCYALAMDESNDIRDSAPLIILIHGTESAFHNNE